VEAPVKHLEAPGRLLGGIWGSSGSIWEASGRHLGGIWEASGRPGLPRRLQGGLRGLGLKKVLHLSARIHFSMKKY
jgi:hypothetical protein